MKPAPIQLLQLNFRKFNVELDEKHAPADPPNPLTSVFTFDGISITTEVGLGEADMSHEKGKVFLVSLRVKINNDIDNEALNQKFSPYRIDVTVHGLILVPPDSEKLAPAEDLAVVNGASLAWSAIREQVLSFTSRMPVGPVILPTVNFHDLKEETKAGMSRKSSN